MESRRSFLSKIGLASAGAFLSPSLEAMILKKEKLKVALVGTGVRGSSFFGKNLVKTYPGEIEFVGLCDINPGRLAYAKKNMGVSCPTFVDFDKMIGKTKPDLILVATTDATHDEYIVKALENDIDVMTEKPMTTDEHKCQAIIEAERKSKKKVIVSFNYRWAPYYTKIKELISSGEIGDLVSIDFNWMLNNYHGASYFRRWHGLEHMSGGLWVHKATHHFDLLNWWVNSDPEEVHAYGALEHYGHNGPFRGDNCRTCPHKNKCQYHWEITPGSHYDKLYTRNEHYDGYVRDNCLFREEINIHDKMSAQVKYKNNVVANYSLTTYSPYEGVRIAFNGRKGRIEAWHGIPFMNKEAISQADMHKQEMMQGEDNHHYKPLVLHRNFEKHEVINVKEEKGGHGGGDKRIMNKIFKHPNSPDPLNHCAGTRDGAMSILIGIAARRSVERNRPVKIEELTDLRPREERIIQKVVGPERNS
ncbi:4,5-dihydroxyphthalate dehydrogenase [Fulvitalea axinellae]|uniref:4,5-dihydroxyphthalate dehydrogenase n=1 Tax=Fulvitalea axinellae TaxID=1182444 RepID=A0AAU9CS29_9BACT|nr:4,5-dihydroxyphthalate dehydrogenase [Fulvitalea axinellae]